MEKLKLSEVCNKSRRLLKKIELGRNTNKLITRRIIDLKKRHAANFFVFFVQLTIHYNFLLVYFLVYICSYKWFIQDMTILVEVNNIKMYLEQINYMTKIMDKVNSSVRF